MAYILGCEKNISDEIKAKLRENDVVFCNDRYSGKQFLKTLALCDMNYYYYRKDKLYSLENEIDIKNVQNAIVNEKSYDEAKNFNEFLINVSRIKQMDKWNFYPAIIQLEHTNRCNARCVMCGHANVDKSKCFDMYEEVFAKIEKLLPFCRFVGLHGYGEPFIAKDLLKYMEIYRRYGVRLYVNTNLSVLPDELLPYIREMFEEINISVDGVTAETYEMIRQGLRFDTLLSNIKRLRRECSDVPVNLHVTLMAQNILEAEEFVYFAKRFGIKKVFFNEMIPLDANMNSCDSLRKYPDITSLYLKKAKEAADSFGIEIAYPKNLIFDESMEKASEQMKIISECHIQHNKTVIRNDGLLFNRKKLTECGNLASEIKCSRICDVFHQQIYVDADGKMAVCCVDGYHYMGNILDFQNISDYWSSSAVTELRNVFASGHLPNICRKCNFILLGNLKELRV